MFVFNCAIDENRPVHVTMANSQKSSKQKKKNSNKRFKTDDPLAINDTPESESEHDILRPVLCSECGTELGVYEPKEEGLLTVREERFLTIIEVTLTREPTAEQKKHPGYHTPLNIKSDFLTKQSWEEGEKQRN